MDFFALAQMVKGCLCVALADTLGGEVCKCSVYPSFSPPADICSNDGSGNGQATVSVTRIFDARDFPSQDEIVRCDGYAALEMTLAVWRCAPMMSDTGDLPSEEELDLASAVLLDDAKAMRCAIKCCLEDVGPISLGQYELQEMSGGCMGGLLTATVAVSPESCLQGSL